MIQVETELEMSVGKLTYNIFYNITYNITWTYFILILF